MDKQTYLRYLRALIATRLPEREAEEAVRYYTEYFEEAGSEQEAEVMASLGSPEELAKRIVEQREQDGEGFPPPPRKHKVQTWQVLLGVAAVIFSFRVVRTVKAVLWNTGDAAVSAKTMTVVAEEGTALEQEAIEQAVIQDTCVSTIDGQGTYVWDAASKPFHSLSIESACSDIMVTQGTSFELAIDGDFAASCPVEIIDGTLCVTDGENSTITVCLPVDTDLKDVSIHTDTGDITWDAQCTIGTAEIVAASGDITWLGKTQAQWLSLHTNSGDVVCEGEGTAETAQFTTDMGDVSVYIFQADCLTAESNLGDVELEWDVTGKLGYDLSTDMGEVYVNCQSRGQKAFQSLSDQSQSVKAHTALGDINLLY